MCQFLGGTDNLEFSDQDLPKYCQNNFKSLNPDLELAPPKYHVCKFFVKTDNFEFFGSNFGKLPNYVRYFGYNNVEGVAESWVEVDGAGCNF